MLGRQQDVPGGSGLDDLAVLHHQDPVAHLADDGQVVADEQQGGARGAAGRQDVEDLGLDGDVEGGGGLVGDDEVGLPGDRRGDEGALAQAAGELVGVLVDPQVGLGHSHLLQQGDGALALGGGQGAAGQAALAGGLALGVDDVGQAQGLGDLPADGAQRGERGQGVLEDEPDAASANGAPLGVGEAGGVLPGDLQAVGGDRGVASGQADERAGGDGLAGPRLADYADGLAGGDGQVQAVHGPHGAVVPVVSPGAGAAEGDRQAPHVDERAGGILRRGPRLRLRGRVGGRGGRGAHALLLS